MSEWIKYSERKPTHGDALFGSVIYAWKSGRVSTYLSIEGFPRSDDPDYWCTPDPLPTEESAVEKAESDLLDWWNDPHNCDYREGIECISALIDAKLAERK